MSATFQCELKQWSPIIQHSSGGFKDQHTLLPEQRGQTHLLVPFSSCIVVDMSFSSPCKTTPVPVSATIHSRARIRISAVAICVCVFSLCAACSLIHSVGAGATWLRTGGTLVSPPPNRHIKKKTHSQTHLCLHPEDTLPDQGYVHTQVNQVQIYHTNNHFMLHNHILRTFFFKNHCGLHFLQHSHLTCGLKASRASFCNIWYAII